MDEAIEATHSLRRLIMGFRDTQLVFVAAKLGIADQLEHGAKTAEELSQGSGLNSAVIYRVLRALATIGLLTESSDGSFALTAVGELLRTNVDGSLRSVALLYGDAWLWHAYGHMLYSAQTGEPAFAYAHGRAFYRFLAEEPAASAVFQDAMSEFSAHETAAILNAYPFGSAKMIVDVGAGQGAFLARILAEHAHLSGIAFDAPTVIPAAERLFAERGLASRTTCVGGDFFRGLPPGGDLYVLKSVLHNWDDTDAARILQACRPAMSAGARLLVIERVIPPAGEASEAKLFDINMLVVIGGRERTIAEYRVLLETAGFTLNRAIPTTSPLSIVEAMPDL
jgi:hypothetical protein